MAKAFARGQRLGEHDLCFVCTVDGAEQAFVTNVRVRIMWLAAGREHQVSLNNVEIRNSGGRYCLDGVVSHGLSAGSYVAIWEFQVDGVWMSAVDEFVVV